MEPAHRDHPRTFESFRHVYIVLSRRARGFSIGINLNPNKACNFNCVYCQVNRRIPGKAQVEPPLRRVSRELRDMLTLWTRGDILRSPRFASVPTALRQLNDIALSGDGEPTAVPHFADYVALAADARDTEGYPKVKLVLITDASLLHKPGVTLGVDLLARRNGEIWAKLDAGTEAYYRTVCRTAVPFERILANLQETAGRHPLVIQSLFLDMGGDGGPSAAEIEAYIDRLKTITDGGGRIRSVQVYTVAREPAVKTVRALPPFSLEALAGRIHRGTGLPVEVFPGDWGLKGDG